MGLLKVIGAIVIVLVCSMTGVMVASNFIKRPWELRQLQNSLQMLETEIVYTATPLPEALDKIANQSETPVRNLFAVSSKLLSTRAIVNVWESWEKGIAVLAETSALTGKDLAVLRILGYNLGSSEVNEQTKHLHLAKEQLRIHELSAEEEKKKGEKLWKYCGFLTGLIIVLLIL